MESNRDRHLELGHQGKMAVWVRIAGAMVWNTDLRRKSVFGQCVDATLSFHHCPPIDTQYRNKR